MKNLDFLIVGAQKCATTTLFEHLRQHPCVHMPLEKEVPFFTGENCGEAEWEEYASRQFGVDDDRLWGKATPQYMSNQQVPARIHALMPGVKLVAILRDPVARTLSHYQMGVRRNTESRSFDEAVTALLAPEAQLRARALPAPTHSEGYEPESDFYVSWSEYGRVLGEYARYFGPEQLLVLYTEELERDPAGTLDRLLAFIGLDPGFRPDTLGEVMHRGGTGSRIPHGVRVWLRERRGLYALWQRLPESRRGRLRFLYERWNVTASAAAAPAMSGGTHSALRAHFARDLQILASLGVPQPPWMVDYVPR